MKKIAKKLLFSSLALSASVLTLTTTTYAWYVQNTTATATGITASTKDEIGNSLFISMDGTNWGNKAEFENDNFVFGNAKNYENNCKGPFLPMSYNPSQNVTRFELASGAAAVEASATETGNRLEFSVYLVASAGSLKVQPKLILTNTSSTTDALRPQTAYSTAGLPTTGNHAVAKGDLFWTDAAQALRMSLKQDSSAVDYYDVIDVAKTTAKTNGEYTTAYSAIDYPGNSSDTVISITETDLAKDVEFTNPAHTVSGANAYYRALVGDQPGFGFTSKVQPINVSTARGTNGADGAANEINYVNVTTTRTKLTFSIWLEGTNMNCFDCCAKQSFDFAFEFKVVPTTQA